MLPCHRNEAEKTASFGDTSNSDALVLVPKQQPMRHLFGISTSLQHNLWLLLACRLPPGSVLAKILGHLVRAKNLNGIAIWVKYERLRGEGDTRCGDQNVELKVEVEPIIVSSRRWGGYCRVTDFVVIGDWFGLDFIMYRRNLAGLDATLGYKYSVLLCLSALFGQWIPCNVCKIPLLRVRAVKVCGLLNSDSGPV